MKEGRLVKLKKKGFSFLDMKSGDEKWDELCEKYEALRLTDEGDMRQNGQPHIDSLIHTWFLMCYFFREYHGEERNITVDQRNSRCIRDARILRPLWDFRKAIYTDHEISRRRLACRVLAGNSPLRALLYGKGRNCIYEGFLNFYMEKEGYSKEEQELFWGYIQESSKFGYFGEERLYHYKLIKLIGIMAFWLLLAILGRY